jgi:hypothetical protein
MVPKALYAHASHESAFIKDEQGRTLIFRKMVGIGDIVAPPSLLTFGLGFLYMTAFFDVDGGGVKPRKIDRILAGVVGTGLTILGVIGTYVVQHHYRHMNTPLIVLDEKGIWHESWKNILLWSDIDQITFIRMHQYTVGDGDKSYHGFNWHIELKTKAQKKFTLDERTIRGIRGHQHSHSPETIKEFRNNYTIELPQETDGGLLGMLISQYYAKYKTTEPSDIYRNQ